MREIKKEYAKLERHITNLFIKERTFNWNGKAYITLLAGKPRPSAKNGECKTDVYIKGKHDEEIIELKISVKMKNKNEWQESKISPDRAQAIFGDNWSEIIKNSTEKIKDKFESLPLLYANQKGATKENSATMGWRLEITSKERNLSVPLALSDTEIKNSIYKGVNLPSEKKNANVNGETILNSGVAEFILYSTIEELISTKDVLSSLIKIDDMATPKTYLTFIANNYRSKENKIDGSRPLAVYIDWKSENGKLIPKVNFDNPLQTKGKDLVAIFKKEIDKLGKKHPSEIDSLHDVMNSLILYKKAAN